VNQYEVIGMMSGSSLDGLDLARVVFTETQQGWNYNIVAAECISYDDSLRTLIRNIPSRNAYHLAEMHVHLGRIFGQYAAEFIQKSGGKDHIICVVSHGQTIFHQPEKGFTCQIGDGATIASITGVPCVCDLRSADVALGGQGAPLVPGGEQFLFPDQQVFVNIGGIANISIHHQKQITAFDICPGNTLLNFYAQKLGVSFDKGGFLASKGSVILDLLSQWNEVSFLKVAAPKSLGTEHIFENWLNLDSYLDSKVEDKLTTAVEHIATQISLIINTIEPKLLANGVLFTGGGALNEYLMESIRKKTNAEIVIPKSTTINFKEALIMAFLGLQRWLGKTNALSAVTGASRNSIGGAIYL
jgi:anhydro-N-acetylmuramic acid kinase